VKAEDLIQSKNRIDAIVEALKGFESLNAVTETDRDLSITVTLDPTFWNSCSTDLVLPDPEGPAVAMTLRFSLGSTTAISSSLNGGNSWPGVLYRVPRSIETMIAIAGAAGDDAIVFHESICYAQFGTVAMIDLGANVFASTNTGIEFSGISGRLLKLTRNTTGSAAPSTAKLATSADTVSKDIDELKKHSGDQAELERLRLQAQLIGAREALRRAQQDPKSAVPPNSATAAAGKV
jgi:hypothetical protein